MNNPLHVSPTGIQRFARCCYEFYLRNILGIKPVGIPRPLGFGSAFHKALEEGNKGKDSEEAFRFSLAAWQDVVPRYALSPEDSVIGRVLLTGYWALYQPSGGTAEQRLTVPLMAPDGSDSGIELRCIVDLLGEGYAEEHKTTTSDPTVDKYWERVDGNIQCNTYFIASEDSGNTLEYLVWDVIRAPQLKRRKQTPISEQQFYKRNCKGGNKGDPKPGTYLEDETLAQFEERFAAEVLADPASYFVRRKLYRSDTDLEKTRYDLWAWAKQIEAAIVNGAFPRNLDSCRKFRRPCDYYKVCHEGVDPHQSELYTIRTKDDDDEAAWEDQ